MKSHVLISCDIQKTNKVTITPNCLWWLRGGLGRIKDNIPKGLLPNSERAEGTWVPLCKTGWSSSTFMLKRILADMQKKNFFFKQICIWDTLISSACENVLEFSISSLNLEYDTFPAELNPCGCTIRVKKANRAEAEGCFRGGSCVTLVLHSGCPPISMRDDRGTLPEFSHLASNSSPPLVQRLRHRFPLPPNLSQSFLRCFKKTVGALLEGWLVCAADLHYGRFTHTHNYPTKNSTVEPENKLFSPLFTAQKK